MLHTSLARFLAAVLLLCIVSSPLTARKNVRDLELTFLPQQSVAASEVTISEAMIKEAIDLRLRDKRPHDDLSIIGTRTDDDDRRHDLHATNEVGAFVAATLSEVAADWNLRIEDDSDLVIDIAITEFKITETNQAFGATYEAAVKLSAALKRGGTEAWSGTISGDATRYGRKFSNENVNEVLSDAVLEAFAVLLSSPDLHRAWASR